jgi:hypothetical protein
MERVEFSSVVFRKGTNLKGNIGTPAGKPRDRTLNQNAVFFPKRLRLKPVLDVER